MNHRLLSSGLAAALALVAALPLAAQQFALAVDVPSSLGGTVYGANQIVQYNGSYSLGSDLSADLGPAGHVTALTQVSPGVYYLAVDVPTTISAATYQPGDIVKASGGGYGLIQSGAALGLPPGVGIGAITRTPAGTTVIAFTAPASIASATYLPGDLIQVNGTTLSLYWSGTGNGVPPGARIAGAEIMADNELLLAFDIPVTLAGTTFMPGMIARFSGGFISSPWFSDGTFPAASAMTDFALPGSPGTVPDGSLATTPLLLAKSATPGSLDLSWGSPCSAEATGYAVYEGTLGTWYNHSALACVGNATAATVAPNSGDRYYLVVPDNGDYEGGYGKDSSASEIPPGASRCRTVSDIGPCP